MMILMMLALGTFLSAFFSGSETGFYRVTRVRLLMDAMSGNLIARGLMWLADRPTLVVATVLIGNNIANYLVSFSLVLASQALLVGWGESVQTMVPVLATPLLFIYGELLPKYLYYNAPYLLSTRGAPLMIFCAALFLPISMIVISLESLWLRFMGGKSTRFSVTLEKRELQRVMLEGQEAGLLQPVQRELAQNLFTYGMRPVRQFAIPLRALPTVKAGTEREEILKLASQFRQRYVGMLDANGKQLVGCYSVSELLLGNRPRPMPVYEVPASESTIQVLCKLQAQASPMARIVDGRRQTIGVVSRDRLVTLLLPND